MSAYPYTCEHCPAKVPLTRADFQARDRVLCDACTERLARVTTARKLHQFSRSRTQPTGPRCDDCGTTNTPRKHVRLNPRNLRDEHALLCLPCGRRLGYQPVNHDRIAANVHGREAAA